MNIIISFIIAVGIVTSGLWGIAYYLGPDHLKNCTRPTEQAGEKCQKADVIVAVSGGDTGARTREAVRLYNAGWGDTLLFSGAAYSTDGPSNAATMRNLAIEQGVKENDIVIEEKARDTEENALYSKPLLKQVGADRVILVTSAYHQRRAQMQFERALPAVGVVSHPAPDDSTWTQLWWMTPTGWWLALGELAKITYAFFGGESS